MVGGGKYSRYETVLRKMEPGHAYTARELAYLSKDSSTGVGGILRKGVIEGRVEIVDYARTGCGKGWVNVYRLKEVENDD